MWAFHQTHHSSEDYNLSTALRQSVFQMYTSWVNVVVNNLRYRMERVKLLKPITTEDDFSRQYKYKHHPNYNDKIRHMRLAIF